MRQLEMPACIGCSAKFEFLCCDEQFCCKLGTPALTIGISVPEGKICEIGLGCCTYGLKVPTTCCKGQEQFCCFAGTCALPPDDEVPATCALLGFACMPGTGCLKKLGDLKSKGAPELSVMER